MTSNELLEGFPFRHSSDPNRIIHLNSVARGLLEMFYLCVETAESEVLLTWPSRIENVAILHALAELHEIVIKSQAESQPEPLRLCTYFWPWKQNTDYEQKHILVDRTKFAECNFPYVINYMNEPYGVDYAFHMALNCIRDLNPEANVKHTRGHRTILPNHPEFIHPTLFEITPQAVFQSGKVKNLPLAKDGFLSRTSKYIRACELLSDARLFQIDSAPFFMLSIPYVCTTRDLCRGDLFPARRPNIVLIDLTNVFNRIGKTWHKQVAELLSVFIKVYSNNENGAPPVCAITDDPTVFNKLCFKVVADYEEKRRQKRNVSRYAFLNITQSIFVNKSKADIDSPVPSIMVASYADDMVDVFLKGQELRNKAMEIGSDVLAEQFDVLNHTMRNVVNMPGGFDDYMEFLQEYCDQTGHDIQSVALKPLEKWIRTKELVEDGDAGTERIEAEEHLKNCKVIIDGLKQTTPLQSRLDELYEKLLGKQGGRHVFVFPNKQMKEFAEWMISKRINSAINSDGNGATSLVFFDSRQALDLSESILNKYENVYFILPRQKYLSQMIAQQEMPLHLTFVCDGGTVLSLLRYVDILEKIPGLEIIRPRLTAIRQALQRAADSRISLLGELDEVKLIANTLIFNLREYEPGHYQGHPVVILTEEKAIISAYEGSDILRYQEENDLQPFSKVSVAQLQEGNRFFVITPDFLDAASDKINITAIASESLRDYHSVVLEKVSAVRGCSLREKAEAIQQRMRGEVRGTDIGEGENVSNIIRWINVEGLLEIPRELVRPHAPKILKVFMIFMKALSISDGEIDWYWTAAIQSTRTARIRAGLDRNRVFYKLLLDSTSAKQYFHGDKGDLRDLIDIACKNVLTVSHIIKEHDDEHPEH